MTKNIPYYSPTVQKYVPHLANYTGLTLQKGVEPAAMFMCSDALLLNLAYHAAKVPGAMKELTIIMPGYGVADVARQAALRALGELCISQEHEAIDALASHLGITASKLLQLHLPYVTNHSKRELLTSLFFNLFSKIQNK